MQTSTARGPNVVEALDPARLTCAWRERWVAARHHTGMPRPKTADAGQQWTSERRSAPLFPRGRNTGGRRISSLALLGIVGVEGVAADQKGFGKFLAMAWKARPHRAGTAPATRQHQSSARAVLTSALINLAPISLINARTAELLAKGWRRRTP